MISDATRLDDAADRLADHYRGDPGVQVKSRRETLTWSEHANLLLAEADTRYFCWHPQDDLVSPGEYFELLVSALERDPDRVLAFPAVYRKVTVGRFRRRPAGEIAYRQPEFELGRARPEEEAVRMLREWNMALGCWRGVFRTDRARPIPQTDDCADLVWVFSMALAGSFIAVEEARYLKRFHRSSAINSMRWEGMAKALDLYRAEIEARIGPDPSAVQPVLREVRRYLRRHRLVRVLHPLRPLGTFVLNRPRAVRE